MSIGTEQGSGALLRFGGLGLLLGALAVGCGKPSETPQPAVEAPAPQTSTSAASPTPAQPATQAEPRAPQPFAEAVITDPPPPDQLLPETTLTGKSVGKLYLEVSRVWDTIALLGSDGNPRSCLAILETDLGPIEITLRPDLAPNHVRNFIALVQTGYYDGLVFERTVHEESETQPDVKVDIIEAGCPIGTGDQGYGSIGYWLKREITGQASHEEGTVGACHGENPDTAACKFYITLSPAPVMDGEFTIFGKVTRGLDVARKIFSQPVRNDAQYPQGDRPEKPIVIHKASIKW